MATPAGRLVQDQNLNIHSAGAPLGGKADVFRAAKKGAPSGRKALNDISNSGKPSALQMSRKHNSINVTAENDLGAPKIALAVGSKGNFPKGPEKGQVGGRKALSDLTNSVKPAVQHLSKKVHDKKLTATVEETIPNAITEEIFLHNHQECTKVQRKPMNFGYFLETVGLDTGIQAESFLHAVVPSLYPVKRLEMEEMQMLLNENLSWGSKFPGYSSPACRSPKSVKPVYENWKDEDSIDFKLIETPRLQKPSSMAT